MKVIYGDRRPLTLEEFERRAALEVLDYLRSLDMEVYELEERLDLVIEAGSSTKFWKRS